MSQSFLPKGPKECYLCFVKSECLKGVVFLLYFAGLALALHFTRTTHFCSLFICVYCCYCFAKTFFKRRHFPLFLSIAAFCVALVFFAFFISQFPMSNIYLPKPTVKPSRLNTHYYCTDTD